MGQFQPAADPSTVWLRGLIEAMDEVATSAAKPSAADRKAMANRLELPAMPARLGVARTFSSTSQLCEKAMKSPKARPSVLKRGLI